MYKRTLIVFILGGLLLGCAVDPSSYNAGLRKGMTLSQARDALLFTTYGGDDPFLGGCFRWHDPETDIGIIAAKSRKAYYVFENLNSLSNYCAARSSGGSYVSWFSSFESARRVVDTRKSAIASARQAAIASRRQADASARQAAIASRRQADQARERAARTASSSSAAAVRPGSIAETLAHLTRQTVPYPNGDVYTGNIVNGEPHGAGTMAHSNGAVYVGSFVRGIRSGEGTFTLENGDKYVGAFEQGVYRGQGTLYFSDGGTYEGSFEDGDFNGRGTLTLADGFVRYEGEFEDDEFSGQGTYYLSDGGTYEGSFENGDFNGRGTLTSPNGEFTEGIFENDELVELIGTSDPPLQEPSPNVAIESSANELLQASSGSGFAVTYDGHLVTNNHVIEGCQNVRVHAGSNSVEATVIARDEMNDLALLKADFSPTAIFTLADNNPRLMQDIYVAGFPFGENISSSIKVTKGIVSSLSGLGTNFSEIQIDAAIQPGNSGGPIFDEAGNLIGVAVYSLNDLEALETFGVIPQNTNFGVKSSIVSNLLASNGVTIRPARTTRFFNPIDLGELATNATFYLSCWMTLTQIETMSSTKVMFDTLRQ